MHGKLSPFVRKVMIFAIEKGIEGQVEIVPTAVGQGKTNHDLIKLNPTGKIPTLITDSGEPLFDSLVICDYLDSLTANARAIPLEQPTRTAALTMNAVADGLIVAGVLATIEKTKAIEKQWPEYEEAQWTKVRHCIAALDVSHRLRGNLFDIGTVGAVCALGWLDARASHIAWRSEYPEMASWFDALHSRKSVSQTRPA